MLPVLGSCERAVVKMTGLPRINNILFSLLRSYYGLGTELKTMYIRVNVMCHNLYIFTTEGALTITPQRGASDSELFISILAVIMQF